MTCFDSTMLRWKNAFQNSRPFSISSLMVVLLLERRLPETECSSVDSSLVKKKKKNPIYCYSIDLFRKLTSAEAVLAKRDGFGCTGAAQ